MGRIVDERGKLFDPGPQLPDYKWMSMLLRKEVERLPFFDTPISKLRATVKEVTGYQHPDDARTLKFELIY